MCVCLYVCMCVFVTSLFSILDVMYICKYVDKVNIFPRQINLLELDIFLAHNFLPFFSSYITIIIDLFLWYCIVEQKISCFVCYVRKGVQKKFSFRNLYFDTTFFDISFVLWIYKIIFFLFLFLMNFFFTN